MNNILILSMESSGVKTEELYFRNKKNRKECSFKRDKVLLRKLGINQLFFDAIDFTSKPTKINSVLSRLKSLDSEIDECYVFCDRDTKSFYEKQIKDNFKRIKKILEQSDSPIINEAQLVFYKNEGQNFESFLMAHDSKNKLFEGYSKTEKKIYEKTMGKNGKSLETLKSNLSKIDGNGALNTFLTKNREVLFD